ncbi:MAG: LuxR C-terminal-related transcriptional regulator [Vicinamibacterales bacterium]
MSLRVILVGPPDARARLRARLPDSLEVVGEAPTVAAAQRLQRERAVDALMTSTAAVSALDEDDEIDEPLTARELEVLSLMAEGLPNKRIATRLAISDQTVKFHVASIGGKLTAVNRTDAVRRGLRRGLIAL